ncbi:hypothetical protein ABK040_013409 [Willaertia magna]
MSNNLLNGSASPSNDDNVLTMNSIVVEEIIETINIREENNLITTSVISPKDVALIPKLSENSDYEASSSSFKEILTITRNDINNNNTQEEDITSSTNNHLLVDSKSMINNINSINEFNPSTTINNLDNSKIVVTNNEDSDSSDDSDSDTDSDLLDEHHPYHTSSTMIPLHSNNKEETNNEEINNDITIQNNHLNEEINNNNNGFSTPTLLRQRILNKYKQQLQRSKYHNATDTDTDLDDELLLSHFHNHKYYRALSWIVEKLSTLCYPSSESTFPSEHEIINPSNSGLTHHSSLRSVKSVEEFKKLERAQRSMRRDMQTMFISGFSIFGIFLIVFYNVYFNTNVLKDILMENDNLIERIYFTLKCVLVSAAIFPILILSIIGNRLFKEASSGPLASLSATNRDLQQRVFVQQRVLQNSIEQFMLHALNCAVLSYYLPREDLRIIVFATITFIITRFLFWIGYQIHHSLRALGIYYPILLMIF